MRLFRHGSEEAGGWKTQKEKNMSQDGQQEDMYLVGSHQQYQIDPCSKM